jgi:hypothetical protein
MWADQDQNRGFGGRLDWSKSPFTSQFRDLRWGQRRSEGLGGGAAPPRPSLSRALPCAAR